MSIRNLWRRKLRTALTILGVVIGTSSIVLMLSLGIAMETNFREQLAGMSSLTVIDVWADGWNNPDGPKLDDKAVASFSQINGVAMVIPDRTINGYLELDRLRTNWSMRLKAMSIEEIEAMGYIPDMGNMPSSNQTDYILFGEGYAREFSEGGKVQSYRPYNQREVASINIGDVMEIDLGEYDWQTGDPLKSIDDEKVRIPRNEKVTVEGLFSEGGNLGYEIIISVALYEELLELQKEYHLELYGKEQYEERYEDEDVYSSVKVKVKTEDDVIMVQEAINALGYRSNSPMEYLEEMQTVSGSIQIILGGIGAVSLFVAAIGITNTMMMSIYERTKEIGIMKVIGAKITDIQKLFLVEAFMIGAIGGLTGVLFSYLISYMINQFGSGLLSNLSMSASGDISQIPFILALSAFGFATLIGLVSGYFPARRAMKLSALSAIKTE